ncbi:xanthine dehydrogenase family protein molybdopterin-binding subunit [Limimaricola cinnabarinus]|uniref:Periplasmic aromatic aldehyde oxidoreductase, molybdenum binding subunit YagR n=1 Tax=Limimaricola cinnabarinus LL-001 TaxID=1337093 RepID=U3AJ13_9RHOB|nr:xanthine dehydrogenase family protein molybdopterin-binding subunit [Limimaricola cinnabarinus]GAD57669.1 periplasmic aromatic aldehyde oxidoreductase, molybdenum binding subunit YagR [Limimaricola cinnabarinus LL-001]
MAQTINTEVTRTDAPRKVTGAAHYAADFTPAGMLHGALATSRIAVGTLTGIDTSKAEAEPGVVAVFTHDNLPDYKTVKGFYAGGPGSASFWPMEGTEIRYAGQPIAYVVAETAAAARRGAQLIEPTYEEGEANITMDPSDSFVIGAGEDSKGMTVTKGDVSAGLSEAAQSVDVEYVTPFQHHNPMEMFAATAEWRGDRLTVWMPSQSVRTLRHGISKAYGLPETSVRVVSPFVGGAFGSKAGITPYTMLTIAAAKAVNAPVRLIVTRPQMYTVATFRPESVQKFRIGADASGKLTAFEHIEIAQTSQFDEVVNPGTHMTRAMYASPNIHTEQRLSRSDTNTGGFMRAPNEMQTFFGLESAMDELALKLGMDPVELRRVNDTQTHPVAEVPFSSRSLMECYDAASASFGWAGRNPEVGSMTDGDWLVGYGCATATYPTNVSPSAARVRMQGTGHAFIELAAHDVGTGSYTIFAQIAAARLGLPVSACDVVMGEAHLPLAPISGGSTTAASAGSAVHLACLNVAAQVAREVSQMSDSPFSGVDPERITLVDGVLRGPEGQSQPLLEALSSTPRGEATAEGEYRHPALTDEALRLTYQGGYGVAGPVTPEKAMFAFGAEFAEVHIHRWTHEIRVPRLHGAFAAGTWLNRKTAHSQLMGGMVWGIGSALHEVTEVDLPRARFLNANIAEYLVPVNADVREVRVEMLEEQDDYVNPLGVKGIGELGIVGTAAAIGNAIHHATGKRLRKIPMRMSDLV